MKTVQRKYPCAWQLIRQVSLGPNQGPWAKTTSGNFFFLFFFVLGLHAQHMEVPELRVELKLQLPAYSTATATRDLSRVCNLYHRSRQCQIPHPLSKARDRTHGYWLNLFPLHHNGNSSNGNLKWANLRRSIFRSAYKRYATQEQ